MIIRRIIGSALLLFTSATLLNRAASENYDVLTVIYAFGGLWLTWAWIVALTVRDQLPVSFGRFVLRMIGIDR